MEIELARCDCCGLKEECTIEYISEVKRNFEGKWLCGLCSEAVRDEVNRGKNKQYFVDMEEAVKAHMSFCSKYKSNNPAVRVADGMRQMLRRRSVRVWEQQRCGRVRTTSPSQVLEHRRAPQQLSGSTPGGTSPESHLKKERKSNTSKNWELKKGNMAEERKT
ncbi:hypothetical protein HAX54_022344 [Datura stramonium]|uniref:DUF1677 family protein n=1 Tax=Datura stramonium TaxID=4076 RepID=A0ABS8S4B0_DATST|nr:hypothetical protein [Datura stramonium]